MDVEVIKSYQRWAEREYVTALTCKNHTYHRLIPFQKGGTILLICPREDYCRELGLSDYLSIRRKVQMAEVLWRMR